MKRILKSIFVAVLLTTSIFSYQIFAKPNNEVDKENLMNMSNHILKDTKLTQKQKINKLTKLGWEIQTNDKDDSTSIESAAGDGKITNYFLKSSSYPGLYLVEALWEWTGPEDNWDATGSSAYDVIGITITDEWGNAVNAQGTNGGIVVQDQYGSTWANAGTVYSYQASGATYTIDDGTFGADQKVGYQGYAWYYIEKPTSGNSYYMKSQWLHTWKLFSVTLQSISIKYPIFSVDAVFSSTPSQWGTADQDRVYFN